MKVCTVYLVSLQIERQEATCFCIGLESVSDVYMYSVSIIVICSTCNVHSFCVSGSQEVDVTCVGGEGGCDEGDSGDGEGNGDEKGGSARGDGKDNGDEKGDSGDGKDSGGDKGGSTDSEDEGGRGK